MKTYTIAALAAATAVCAVAPAYAASVDEIVAAGNEVLDVMGELTTVLDSVTDKASADAAAPKVKACAEKMKAAMQKQQDLGMPTDAQRKEISEKHPEFEERANTVVPPMLESAQRVMEGDGEPCFGSAALIDAVMSMQ